MRIGLYFGSFNPVHVGHLIIANYFAVHTDLNQIWFVVSPQNPLKKKHSLLTVEHRKSLIDLAIQGETKLRSSNIEFKLPKPNFTIDTLTYLSEKYPNNTFVVIMGSDSFSNIKRWKNHEMLLNQYEIYIYNRQNYRVTIDETFSIKVFEAPLLDISSTYIRRLIVSKKVDKVSCAGYCKRGN